MTANIDGKIDNVYHACAHGCEVQTIINEHAAHSNEQSLRDLSVDMVIMICQIKQ